MSEPFIIRVEKGQTEKYYLTGKNGEQLPFCLEVSKDYVTKRWYFNGELHREDGPAIEFSTGANFWYLNGELIAKKFGNPGSAPEPPENWDESVKLSRIKQMMTE